MNIATELKQEVLAQADIIADLEAKNAKLRQALTEANERVYAVEDRNINLEQRIEYANAGDLVTIPRELVLAMEAKMKEQAAEISRLAMDLEHHKYALDDSCACGHSLDNHEKSGIHPCSLCHCPMFFAKVAK